MAGWLGDDCPPSLFPFPSLLLSMFLSLWLSPPPAITPLPVLPFLSSWIIMFLAFCIMPAFALSPPTVPQATHFYFPPLLSHYPSSAHSSFLLWCRSWQKNRCTKSPTFWKNTNFCLPEVAWKDLLLWNIIDKTVYVSTGVETSFLPIQAVGQGRRRCSVPTFGMPPCTLCRILQTLSSLHWLGTGTLPRHPRHPWNIVTISDVWSVIILSKCDFSVVRSFWMQSN